MLLKKMLKTVALILSLIMLMSIIACSKAPADSKLDNEPTGQEGDKSDSNNTSNSKEDDPADEPATEEKELLTISVYHPLHPTHSLEDTPESGFLIDNMYEEMFNVEFDFQYVPATNEEEVFNITMASDDIPDIVRAGNLTKLRKYSDAWWDLNDFIIGKYEHLEEYFFDDPDVYTLSAEQDGQIKIISMLSEQFIGDVLLVRGDLVEEWDIDLSTVKTKEDWYEVLKLVQEKDSSVIPYMTRMLTPGLTQRLCEGWNGLRQYEFVDVDETVKYGVTDPRMKETVEWLNKLYKEKLIDQEYPTTDTAVWQEQVLGEGVFLTHDNASSRIRWAETEWKNLGVTDKYYIAVPPIQPDEKTKGYTTIHYPKIRDTMAIYVGASEDKVDRILEMINYTYSPEGIILSNYGIEGTSFEYNADGEIDLIEEYQTAVDEGTMPKDEEVRGSFIEKTRIEPNGIYMPQNRDHVNIVNAAKMYEDGGLIRRNMLEMIHFTDEELKEVTNLNADIKTYTDENLDQFIMGIRPMSEWDDFIADYERVKLERYLEIHNDALKRALELRQSQ